MYENLRSFTNVNGIYVKMGSMLNYDYVVSQDNLNSSFC